MKTILITGASGQLGQCIKDIQKEFSKAEFIYKSSKELDITDKLDVISFFKENHIDYCINCAAYTAVDKAEEDKAQADKVNALGAIHLAQACNLKNTTLIHISTDFVFNGQQSFPYSEEDKEDQKGVYGFTKLKGEQKIKEILNTYYIIRTSWLYSEFGNNFLKTMLRLAESKNELSIIYDQVGTPTYAKDLARCILLIVNNDNKSYGTYHFSNEGVASWYDFAKEIFSISKIKIKTNPIKTILYPTPAIRPKYSVLAKEKIKTNFSIDIPYWKDSLKQAILALKN